VAQALFISDKTAGVHVSNILGKLGVSGRGEAAAVAHRLGLLDVVDDAVSPASSPAAAPGVNRDARRRDAPG
jgi:hypothetical protein